MAPHGHGDGRRAMAFGRPPRHLAGGVPDLAGGAPDLAGGVPDLARKMCPGTFSP